MSSHHLRQVQVDFSGGPVARTPPSRAGDVGSIFGWVTKIPHAKGQLSPCTTTKKKAPAPQQRVSRVKKRKSQLQGNEVSI